MTTRKKIILAIAVLAVIGLLFFALRPSPVPVSAATVVADDFVEYVEDEGRTRLREPHVMTSPIAGYLQRVALEPGDEVDAGDVIFRLEPMPAPALDARAREEAREQVQAARARLEAAESDHEARRSDFDLAETEFQRSQQLHLRQIISSDEMDRARARRDAARAAQRSAEHRVEVARFELDAARARIEIADGQRPPGDQPTLDVAAPVAGTVTQRHRRHEGPVRDGEEILEIGDLSTLEVQIDLLSMDAVRVRPGMRVVLERWGGAGDLEGRVRRVEPAGFTRVSALGVDEQRVPVQVNITSPRAEWRELGDGYRVEGRFILWEGEDVVQIPTSALFRSDDRWAVFVVEEGRAAQREVAIGRRSGLRTQITAGVEPGEIVITHPSDRVADGTRVDAEMRAR